MDYSYNLLSGASDPDGDEIYLSHVDGVEIRSWPYETQIRSKVIVVDGKSVTLGPLDVSVLRNGVITVTVPDGAAGPGVGQTVAMPGLRYRASDGKAASDEQSFVFSLRGLASEILFDTGLSLPVIREGLPESEILSRIVRPTGLRSTSGKPVTGGNYLSILSGPEPRVDGQGRLLRGTNVAVMTTYRSDGAPDLPMGVTVVVQPPLIDVVQDTAPDLGELPAGLRYDDILPVRGAYTPSSGSITARTARLASTGHGGPVLTLTDKVTYEESITARSGSDTSTAIFRLVHDVTESVTITEDAAPTLGTLRAGQSRGDLVYTVDADDYSASHGWDVTGLTASVSGGSDPLVKGQTVTVGARVTAGFRNSTVFRDFSYPVTVAGALPDAWTGANMGSPAIEALTAPTGDRVRVRVDSLPSYNGGSGGHYEVSYDGGSTWADIALSVGDNTLTVPSAGVSTPVHLRTVTDEGESAPYGVGTAQPLYTLTVTTEPDLPDFDAGQSIADNLVLGQATRGDGSTVAGVATVTAPAGATLTVARTAGEAVTVEVSYSLGATMTVTRTLTADVLSTVSRFTTASTGPSYQFLQIPSSATAFEIELTGATITDPGPQGSRFVEQAGNNSMWIKSQNAALIIRCKDSAGNDVLGTSGTGLANVFLYGAKHDYRIRVDHTAGHYRAYRDGVEVAGSPIAFTATSGGGFVTEREFYVLAQKSTAEQLVGSFESVRVQTGTVDITLDPSNANSPPTGVIKRGTDATV